MVRYGREFERGYDRSYRAMPPRRSRVDWPGTEPFAEGGPGYRTERRGWWGFAPYDPRTGIREEPVRRYGWDYKSRGRVDYGDPFLDRARGTPIRAYRGPRRTGDRPRAHAADDPWHRGGNRYDAAYPTRWRPDTYERYEYWI